DLHSGAHGAAVSAFAVADPPKRTPSLDPRLAELVAAGEVRGEPGATCVLHQDGGRHVVAAGAGRLDELDADSIRNAAAAVARLRLGRSLAWHLDPALPLGLADQARGVVDGVVLGGYDQGKWKPRSEAAKHVERLILDDRNEDARQVAPRTEGVAQCTNRARDLANRPPNDLTPRRLAEHAQEVAA